MATDRDEQLRQKQELEEIRRSFAEMGARMGSLFEPAELDEPEQADRRPPPASPHVPPVTVVPARPRWWWAGAVVLLFVAGTVFGYLLPRDQGGGDSPSPPSPSSATTRAQAATPPAEPPKPRTSVPESCLETAEKGDEVIARLTANMRDNRLAEEFRDYTIASQACRKEASR